MADGLFCFIIFLISTRSLSPLSLDLGVLILQNYKKYISVV